MTAIATITVVVEQRHIDAGKRWDQRCCPVALAAREQGLKNACLNTYTGRLVMFAMKGYSTHYVSMAAGAWGGQFDLGTPVKPKAFVFEAAPARARMGA